MPDVEQGLALLGPEPLGCVIGWLLAQAALSECMNRERLLAYRDFVFVVRLAGDRAEFGRITDEEQLLPVFQIACVHEMSQVELPFLFRHA